MPIIAKPPVEEGRYGFGTTAAVDSFIRRLTTLPFNGEIILLVNIATLLRNNLSAKDKFADSSTIVKTTQLHMVGIANEIAQICAARFKDTKHHILYYLTDPAKQVPKEWQKPWTAESAIALSAATAAFCRSNKSYDQESGNTSLHVRLADKMRCPSYRGIEEALRGMARTNVPFHMISHFPMDYHVASVTGRAGVLYRSHTGLAAHMTPSELGKIVFKMDDIPFYRNTHVLFGDKVLVKGSIDKKQKAAILDDAKKTHWAVRTNEYISTRLNDYGVKLPYSLN